MVDSSGGELGSPYVILATHIGDEYEVNDEVEIGS